MSDETLFQRASRWISDLLAPDEDDGEKFDEDFIASLRFKYVTVRPNDGELDVRCNLCGRVFDETPNAFEHVAEHNDLSGASIDPFAPLHDTDYAVGWSSWTGRDVREVERDRAERAYRDGTGLDDAEVENLRLVEDAEQFGESGPLPTYAGEVDS